MQSLETTIPWWRKALNFALDGIRSGFGLFSRSSKTEAGAEPKFTDTLEETQEKETTLIDPSLKPESVAAAPAILATPVAVPESTAAAEPIMEAAQAVVAASEAVAVPEPIEAPEPVPEAEPEIAEPTVEAEPVSEALPDPVESAEPVAETEPESAQISEAEIASDSDPELFEEPVLEAEIVETREVQAASEALSEPVESAEPVVEAEPESAEISETEVVNDPAPEAVEESQPEPEAEPEIARAAEAEPASEALPEPVESVEPVVETEPESAEISEAEIASESDPELIEEPVLEAEIAETREVQAASEALSEPVESVEPAVETEPEPAELSEPEIVNESVSEPIEETETQPEAEPEIAVTVEAEPTSEALPEPVESAEPVAEAEPTLTPEPATGAPIQLVLSTEPTADQKAAAKLAAQQKKRDESSEESPFSVVVGQVYDGPLDLLLDLIRKQDIDIYDIPIAKITAQFLAYVNQLKAGDVDVAGEFIYTASLLIHIKSRMLLPRAPSGPEDEAEDPRRELVERLLEHERFKNAAQMLQQKQMLEAATWSNPGSREFKDDAAAEPEIAADTVDLVRVFSDILERARKRPVLDVSEDSVTVGQMIQFLARRLTMEDKPIALRRMLSHTRSERALIAMFLALLELVRLQAILLRQDRAFSEIFIKKHTDFDAMMNDGLANAHDDWR